MKTNLSNFPLWQQETFDQLAQSHALQHILSFLAPVDAAKFAKTSSNNHRYNIEFRYPLAKETVIERLRLQENYLPPSITDTPLKVEHLLEQDFKPNSSQTFAADKWGVVGEVSSCYCEINRGPGQTNPFLPDNTMILHSKYEKISSIFSWEQATRQWEELPNVKPGGTIKVITRSGSKMLLRSDNSLMVATKFKATTITSLDPASRFSDAPYTLVRSAQFNPTNDRQLLTTLYEPDLRRCYQRCWVSLWNANERGEWSERLLYEDGAEGAYHAKIDSAIFSPDAQWIMVVRNNLSHGLKDEHHAHQIGLLKQAEGTTRSELVNLPGLSYEYDMPTFDSTSSKILGLSDCESRVMLWQLSPHDQKWQLVYLPGQVSGSPIFDSTGTKILSLSNCGSRVMLWQLSSHDQNWQLTELVANGSEMPRRPVFDHKGNTIAAYTRHEVYLWTQEVGGQAWRQQRVAIKLSANDRLTALAMSPNGEEIVVGSKFGSVHVLRQGSTNDLGESCSPIHTYTLAGGVDVDETYVNTVQIDGIAFSPDYLHLMTESIFGSVRIYNRENPPHSFATKMMTKAFTAFSNAFGFGA